jgi:hypothetical protein
MPLRKSPIRSAAFFSTPLISSPRAEGKKHFSAIKAGMLLITRDDENLYALACHDALEKTATYPFLP